MGCKPADFHVLAASSNGTDRFNRDIWAERGGKKYPDQSLKINLGRTF